VTSKAAIDEKNTALMSVSQKLGEKMYADQQAKQSAEAQPQAAAEQQPSGASAMPQAAADDNVVDAEVKEVKKGLRAQRSLCHCSPPRPTHSS
jgi:molecular chaperone DnaK